MGLFTQIVLNHRPMRDPLAFGKMTPLQRRQARNKRKRARRLLRRAS